MKLFPFLRSVWKKKNSINSSTQTSSPHLPEHASPEVISASITPKISFGEMEYIQSNTAAEVHHTHAQETSNSKPQLADGQGILAEKLHSAPQFVPHGHYGAPFSHGPPHNLSHGPPNLRISREWNDPLSTPIRPPRPPFLDPWYRSSNQDIESVSVPRSPTRVKFSPAPQTQRPSQSDSSSRSSPRLVELNENDRKSASSRASLKDASTADGSRRSDSCYSHDTESIYSQESALSSSKDDRHLGAIPLSIQDKTTSTYQHSDPTATLINTPDLNSPSLEEKSTKLPKPRTPYHATAAVPFTKGGVSQSKSEFTRETEFSLASSPSSSPPFFRRRPKPLALLPAPTAVQLPPSPAFSSTQSTPPATSTSFSSASPQPQSPSPLNIRAFHRMSPPTSTPPDSPLPTPPMTPSYDTVAAPHLSLLVGRRLTLRSAHSTTELRVRDLRVERRKLSSAHGTTTSAGMPFPRDDSGRHTDSQHERFAATTYMVHFFIHLFTGAIADLRVIAFEKQSRPSPY